VFGAIHAGDADAKLLAYQYLQMLPQIAEGNSNKVWLIPTEFSHALARFEAEFPAPDPSGNGPVAHATPGRFGDLAFDVGDDG
jgi:hypothetical protein